MLYLTLICTVHGQVVDFRLLAFVDNLEIIHSRMECQNLRQSITDVERKCVPVSARPTPDPSPCCIVCFHSAIGHGAVNCAIIYYQVLKAMTFSVSVDCTDADVDIFLHVP